MLHKIPVTVLTGFLGSGKTTLLNRILSEDHGMRIAVIENEFGEIGIDQDLVINVDEEVFEMNNGCICCTVRGDLIRILGDLAERGGQFDRVILETTGMADPGPVAQTFLVQEDVQEFYQLDGVITLIDGKHIGQHLDNETDEVLAQVAFADRIIINKGDLTSQDEKLKLKNRLQSMNSMAEYYFATMADAPIKELLDIGGFNVERAVDLKPNFLEPEYPFDVGTQWQLSAGDYLIRLSESDDNHDHDHDHDHDNLGMPILWTIANNNSANELSALAENVFVHFSTEPKIITHGQALSANDQLYQMVLEGRDEYEFGLSLSSDQNIALFTGHAPDDLNLKIVALDGGNIEPIAIKHFSNNHSHDSKVASVSIELTGLFNGDKLNSWLEQFLIENGPDVYRMKGVVGIEGEDYKFVFQGVHMIFDSKPAGEWGDETPINRLVFIGINLDQEYIRKSLLGCMI